ncbi:MAG: sensor histidine kinase [Tissierellaceae bacterium]|nr:sensor histidine kinase [Tissierellaceae bacterium]
MDLKKYLYIKMPLILILFIAALNFENAQRTRAFLYVLLFVIYLISGIIRYYSGNKNISLASFIIEIIIIYLFEYNSRYQVNYIFHLFYYISLLEIPLFLVNKHSLVMSIISIITSSIKFINLIYFKPGFGNITQGGLFLLTGVFIALLMNFLKYYREEEHRKMILNKQIREANIRLNEMTIVEERNRIARDLHDTIGHGLTGAIMGLEMVQVLIDEDLGKAKEMIVTLKDSSRQNLVRVREVVNTLNPNENISKGVESIEELISSFRANTNVKIDFTVDGNIAKTSPNINIVLYRIVQESLTNAIRHGHADKINILLIYKNQFIELIIKDNGVGVAEINKGFGLKSMEDRVFSLGGNISFMSTDGFSIVANIPMEV